MSGVERKINQLEPVSSKDYRVLSRRNHRPTNLFSQDPVVAPAGADSRVWRRAVLDGLCGWPGLGIAGFLGHAPRNAPNERALIESVYVRTLVLSRQNRAPRINAPPANKARVDGSGVSDGSPGSGVSAASLCTL